MDSRNNRLVKPGTGRPDGRSQNRNASKGARKNSRAAGDSTIYTGSTTNTSGKGMMSVRASDSNAGFKNMPMGKTQDNFNPVPAKKDGFFVHKRGQGYGGT